MIVRLKKRLGGVYLEKNKVTLEKMTEKIPLPKEVILPMNMHAGKPAKVNVEEGDQVKIGSLIGKKDGFISANIHSSIAGKVKKIEQMVIGSKKTDVVVIENDFTEQISHSFLGNATLDAVISDKGIIGMGGAGFPTNVKFLLKEGQKITKLIINAAECEPFVTADQRVILEKTDDFLSGIQLILDVYNIPNATIAIEKHSKETINILLNSITDDRISVKVLKNYYPQGAEKVLIKNILKKELPLGKLPIDLETVILNASTIYSIYNAVENNFTLMERVVTVSGLPLKESKNLKVRIGTPIEYLIEACGGFVEAPSKILNGGPMMGKLVHSLNEPVTKTTNLISVLNSYQTDIPKERPCIKCSECLNVCPMGLSPILISQAYRNNDLYTAEKLGVLSCIDCGGCSYICPSKIDLLSDIREAKQKVMEKKNGL